MYSYATLPQQAPFMSDVYSSSPLVTSEMLLTAFNTPQVLTVASAPHAMSAAPQVLQYTMADTTPVASTLPMAVVPISSPMVAPTYQVVQTHRPHRQTNPQQVHSTVFFAGVTPIVVSETLLALFSQFGRVMDLNLFRPYSGCKTSKGCGLVVFSSRQEAAAAMDALHGKFIWPGARSAMVIEWCDPSKQHKKARAQPLGHTLLQQAVLLQPAHLAGLLPGQLQMQHGLQLPV